MKQTVLILGGGLQAISTARSLKEAGFKVGLLTRAKDFCHASSALDFKIIDSNSPELDTLCILIKKYQISAIIPMSDNMSLFLSKHKEVIQNLTSCKVAVPDYKSIEIASDKIKLMKLCEEHGFPHPLTIQDADLDNNSIKKLPFPVLIKPNHSVGARGIKRVDTPNELKICLPEIKQKYGDCHIQEYIEGNLPYYNVMLYRDKTGKILNYTILKIIRFYPITGGSSCLCQTVDIPALITLSKAVLDSIDYIGFADFDILQTKEGEYKIIEINPRVPASLRGAAISGVNFPALIIADTLGYDYPKDPYLPGKTLRYLGLDLMWFLSSSQCLHTKPSWFKFFGKNIFYQEGGWKDWKPMLKALISNFNKIEIKHGRIRKKQI